MDDPLKPNPPQSPASRLFGWFDRRTGLSGLMHTSLDEPIPGGARLAYVFGSGLLFIFISQVITGICLALYYVPSAETAHTSVAYITKQVAAGAFLRSLHYYGSSAMIVVLAASFPSDVSIRLLQGAARVAVDFRRAALLPGSRHGLHRLPAALGSEGLFRDRRGTNIVGRYPLVGGWLTQFLRGGDTIGYAHLSRFYVAHLLLIPGAIFLFIAAHISFFRKAGPAGPIQEDPVQPKLPPEGFYPRQVLMDMGSRCS